MKLSKLIFGYLLFIIIFIIFFRSSFEWFISILISGLIFIYPFLVGYPLACKKNKTEFFVYAWAYGIIIILSLFFLLSIFSPSMFIFIILINLICLFNIIKFNLEISKLDIKQKWSFFFLLLLASLFTMVMKYFSPYPLQVGQDVFTHIEIINGLTSNHFNFFLTSYSSSININSYTPIFHILMAITSYEFNILPIGLFWGATFSFIFLFLLGTYLLCQSLSINRGISFMVCLISLLFFEIGRASGIYFIMPSTMILVIFPFIVKIFVDNLNKNNENNFFYILLFLPLVFIHYFFGVLIMLLLIFLWLIFKKIKIKPFFFLFILILAYSIIVLIDHFWLSNLMIFNNSFTQFDYDFTTKWNYINSWYSSLPILISIIISILILFTNDLKKSFISSIYLSLLTIFFLPLPLTTRVIILIRPVIAALIGITYMYLIYSFKIKLQKNVKLIIVFFLTILIIISSIFIIPNFINTRITYNTEEGKVSSFTNYEILSAIWIKENTPLDSTILGEPVSQGIIGALSKRKSFGGQYMNLTFRHILYYSLRKNPNDICLISMNNTYLIVDGRLSNWLKHTQVNNLYSNEYFPLILNDFAIIQKLENYNNFELVNNIDNRIYIYKIKQCKNEN